MKRLSERVVSPVKKLFVTFEYTIGKPVVFKIIDTNMKMKAIPGLIENYIRDISGAGKDDTPANKWDVYEITLDIDLNDDTITVTHNCGNLGLVAGILVDILRRLASEDVTVTITGTTIIGTLMGILKRFALST
jgi:hypothetical protein